MAVRFFILDIYFEYIFSFRLLERILKFDYVRSEEFTEEDRRAQEDFKNFGFIYIRVMSRNLLYFIETM